MGFFLLWYLTHELEVSHSPGSAGKPLNVIKVAKRKDDLADRIKISTRTDSRLIPLYEDSPSNITAVLRIETWGLLNDETKSRKLEDHLAPIAFVPNIQSVSSIIAMMCKDQNLVMVVVDELGNALGLLTLPYLVRHALGADTNPLWPCDKGESAYQN